MQEVYKEKWQKKVYLGPIDFSAALIVHSVALPLSGNKWGDYDDFYALFFSWVHSLYLNPGWKSAFRPLCSSYSSHCNHSLKVEIPRGPCVSWILGTRARCDLDTGSVIRFEILELNEWVSFRLSLCLFLYASSHLYMRSCPSVGPSVGPSVPV